jgi:hypothetical protein
MNCSCGKYRDADGHSIYVGLTHSTYEIHTDGMCKNVKFNKWRWRAFHWIERLGHWLSGEHQGGLAAMELYETYGAAQRQRESDDLRKDIQEAMGR